MFDFINEYVVVLILDHTKWEKIKRKIIKQNEKKNAMMLVQTICVRVCVYILIWWGESVCIENKELKKSQFRGWEKNCFLESQINIAKKIEELINKVVMNRPCLRKKLEVNYNVTN